MRSINPRPLLELGRYWEKCGLAPKSVLNIFMGKYASAKLVSERNLILKLCFQSPIL